MFGSKIVATPWTILIQAVGGSLLSRNGDEWWMTARSPALDYY